MKYLDFLAKFKEKGIISIQDIKNYDSNVNSSQINGWLKKGLLLRAKRGYFVLPGEKIDPHILSNKINYSYISLEYALAYHQIIPDIARVITAVSRDRNEKIQNAFGSFYYKKISGTLFTGFTLIESGWRKGRFFRMAIPEKALFDLVYFRSDLKEEKDFKSLRLNLPAEFNFKKLEKYAEAVKAPRIKKRLNNLINYLYDNFKRN